MISKSKGDLNYSELKRFQPASNWEKYFSKIIGYDEEKLKENWQELYQLRNSIAHNRGLTKSEFTKVKSLSKKVTPIINKALTKLDKIKVDKGEKKNITSSVASSTGKYYGGTSSIFSDVSPLSSGFYNPTTSFFRNTGSIINPINNLVPDYNIYFGLKDEIEKLKQYLKIDISPTSELLLFGIGTPQSNQYLTNNYIELLSQVTIEQYKSIFKTDPHPSIVKHFKASPKDKEGD